MNQLIKDIYKQFCKETKRSGGILCGSSITEWNEYLAKNLMNKIPTKLDITKAMVNSKYKFPVNSNDKTVYLIDASNAADRILKMIK